MAGWNKEKTASFKDAFRDFLTYCRIYSKDETGDIPLVLLGSQKRFLNEVFEGLERDIHFFVILKARQLGISTVTRILILFWAFMHPGLRVALIYDTESNKEDARREIRMLLDHLPGSHRLAISDGGDNRNFLEFTNGARIAFMVAGIKKSRSSGGLGRSRGINCCGATEVSSWADIEGLRAFERSLSDKHPDRLYIWESTARSFNIFHDIWKEAVNDEFTKKAIFIGWWAHEGYSLDEGTPIYEKYSFPPSKEEEAKISLVKRRYNHEVTLGQLAWFRHKYDPNIDHPEDEHAGQDIIQQELPWIEEEAFLRSGANFFSGAKLTDLTKLAKANKPDGYRYFISQDFFATMVEPVENLRHAQLKIWEEPDSSGIYCIGADPAGASSEEHCRHVAQVLRCYADGAEQVAEFATMDGGTYEFAWVLMHLCGAYGGATKGARLLLELNGIGNAVWAEIRNMRTLLKTGYLRPTAQERGLTNIMDNVHNFLWTKDDQLTQNPSAFHWETNTKRKLQIMERLRDHVSLGQLKINSVECLDEMVTIVKDGDSVHGDGSNRDDRVIGLALAVHAWEVHERKPLIARNWTRQMAQANRDFTSQDLQKMFGERIVQGFFQQQQASRHRERRMARRGTRWAW